MKLPVSDKVSAFGIKPHIKKGYYPGKLLKVEVFSDSEGNPRVGKYGQQLIFQFAIFKPDPETDAPTVPMKYVTDEKLGIKADVIISKFVYHRYKATKKGEQWVEGEYNTAITPNSAITGVLKALGWEFSAEGDVDPESFVDNWVDLNIADYEQGEGDEAYTASTIKDVDKYKGPEVGEVQDVKPSEKPSDVKKQVKHEAVAEEEKKSSEEESSEIEALKQKIQNMKDLHKEGHLTKEGLAQATESIDAEIKSLRKKQ